MLERVALWDAGAVNAAQIRKITGDFREYRATAAMRGAMRRVRKTTRDQAFAAHPMVFSRRERQLPLSAHSQNTKE